VNAPFVVYDVMVFLQSAVNPHRQHATFTAIDDKRVTLCTDPHLIAEVRDVLNRPSLAARFPALTPQRVAQFIEGVTASAKFFPVVPNVFTLPQHPSDDHLFNLAIHANAKFLVTWETRLLKLPTDSSPTASLLKRLAPNLEIITPKALAERLRLSAT